VNTNEPVLRVADIRFSKLSQLLGRFGLSLQLLTMMPPLQGVSGVSRRQASSSAAYTFVSTRLFTRYCTKPVT